MAQLPTGGSALYLGDFAKPLYGITQNLTSAMIDQYERRKEEGDQDRAAILKALSFEAIENASDKASKMLLDDFNAAQDKFTQMYFDNGLRLTDAQRFEMQKEMRRLDQKRATVKGNVEKAMLVQDLLTKYPDRFKKKSYRDWEQFTREGNIGLKDPFGVLAERPDVISLAKKNFGTILSNNQQISVERGEYDPETGTVLETRTNRPAIEKITQAMFAHPEIQEAILDPDDGKSDEYALNEFAKSFIIDDVQKRVPATAQERKAWEGKTIPKSQRAFKEKYGIDDPTGNVEYFSRFYHGLLRQDESTINAIVGQQAPDGGKITRVETHPDRITIVSEKMVGTGANRKAEETSVDIETPDWSDAGDVRNKIAEVAKYMPAGLKGNRQIEMGLIPPNYEGNYKPAEYTSVKGIENDLLLKPGAIVDLDGEEVKAYSPTHREAIVASIQGVIPGAEIRTEKMYPIIDKDRGKLPIYWTIDGQERTFDLKSDEDRADLIKEIKKQAGRKKLQNLIEEKVGTIAPRSISVTPREQQVEERQEMVNDAKANVITTAKKFDIKSVDDYKAFLAQYSKQSEQEIDSIIQQLGLTDDDFR